MSLSQKLTFLFNIVLVLSNDGFNIYSSIFHCKSNVIKNNDINFKYFNNRNEACVTSCVTSESTISESVHLELTKTLDVDRHNSAQDISENNNSVVLHCVLDSYQNIIAATIDNADYLNEFTSYISKNLNNVTSNITDYQTSYEEKTINLDNEIDKTFLKGLWNSGIVLSRSEKFPFDRKLHMKSFIGNVRTSVNRMKVLLKDIQDKDSIIKFLKGENISNHSWEYFIFNPNNTYNESILVLKDLATWFRKEFPYYHDRCSNCGNSNGNNSYAGIVYPSSYEQSHRAGVTEMYLCGNCKLMTRFPRFNSVSEVLNTRRGRCGEYSALIIRMLNALNYKTRWVSDITDHVWAEVLINGTWIHFDPCEAAVNEPLIYQGWGKNQTYIISYDLDHSNDVQDVTYNYTSDYDGVHIRRKLDGVNDTVTSQILSEAKYNLTEYRKTLATENSINL